METGKRNWVKIWGLLCIVCVVAVVIGGIIGTASGAPQAASQYRDSGDCGLYASGSQARNNCQTQQDKLRQDFVNADNSFGWQFSLAFTVGGSVGAVIFGILCVLSWILKLITRPRTLIVDVKQSGFSPQSSYPTAKETPPRTSLEAELQKLADMKQRGVIDEDEYKRLRASAISRG